MLVPRGRLLRPAARIPVRYAHCEEGAAAVELAIVLPVLLLVIFGIVDLGRALQQQIQLTAGVREAARVGALNGTAADMQNQVSSVVGSSVPLTYSAVAVCTSGSAANSDATITAKRDFVAATPLFSLMQYFGSSTGSTVTLTATGAMGCTG